MIVIDASAMVEALVGRDIDDELLHALEGGVHAPHLLDVEVLSVLSLNSRMNAAAQGLLILW